MHIDNNEIENIASAWNNLLLAEKDNLNLSELEFSALSSWLFDINQSYQNIYLESLKKIKKSDDRESICECVADIISDLEHIQEHIVASQKGFLELMRVLSS